MDNKVYIVLTAQDKASSVVKGFDKQTEQTFDKMRANADKASTGMGGSLQKLKQHWLAVAAAMAGVILGLKKCVTAASDLQEVTSKFEVVFADQIKRAEEWSAALVEGYAMSTRESKQYLSSIQDLLVPMGMQRDLAGQLSFEITKLAADLGSFNNLPTAQVMADIQSALVGNYETMKKYGVVINATMVQEQALAMGLAKTGKELTVAQKAYVAYTMIVKDSEAAVGDMARTSDEYANTVKRWEAATEDLAASIGASLLPALTITFSWLAKIVQEYNKFLNIGRLEALRQQYADVQEQLDALKQQYEYGQRFAHVLEAQGHSVAEANRMYEEQIAVLERRLDLIAKSINEENRLAAVAAKGGAGAGGAPPPGAPPPAGKPLYSEAELEAARIGLATINYELGIFQLQGEAAWASYLASLAAVDAAGYEELRIAGIEATKQAELDLAAAVDAGMEETTESLKGHFDLQKTLADATARSMHATFSNVFFDAFTGKLKTLGDYWDAFCMAMFRTFADMLAAMAVKWLMLKMGFGIATGGWGFLMHEGGVVGETAAPRRIMPATTFATAPRLHGGLKSDEYPVILQQGEEVIPAGEGYGADDAPLLQVTLVADGRELTKLMIRRTEIDSTLLNRLRKALR
ncbi:MAG TPA: hypothetical protein VMW89_17730 [Desulfatiglandales bacterium]|nr:hypothetical protein [Desulfatiglandales bacterium]